MFALCTVRPAQADSYGLNYMQLMLDAAEIGDTATGRWAAEQRNAKIDSYGLNYIKIDYDDLFLLARLVECEAGSYWLPDEWRLAVASVAVNRVNDDRFPDSVYGVIYQAGQYSPTFGGYIDRVLPSESAVNAARLALEGQGNMPDGVVFQANFTQGDYCYCAMYDAYLGWTYFCG